MNTRYDGPKSAYLRDRTRSSDESNAAWRRDQSEFNRSNPERESRADQRRRHEIREAFALRTAAERLGRSHT